jgi:hypothetical protein
LPEAIGLARENGFKKFPWTDISDDNIDNAAAGTVMRWPGNLAVTGIFRRTGTFRRRRWLHRSIAGGGTLHSLKE